MSTPIAHDVKVFVPSKEFELSLSFYERLGWRVNWKEGGLAEIELAEARSYLQDFYAKEWAENFMLYVVVEDAAAWHKHIVSTLANGDFPSACVQPPKKQEYGAIVTFAHDPCGILIHFAQPTPQR
ncbi:MAG: hypothetical protein RJS97_02380 [Parvibaculaceae bacterium]